MLNKMPVLYGAINHYIKINRLILILIWECVNIV